MPRAFTGELGLDFTQAAVIDEIRVGTTFSDLAWWGIMTSGNAAVASLEKSLRIADTAYRTYNASAFSTEDGSEYWFSYLVQWKDLAENNFGWNWCGIGFDEQNNLWFGRNNNSANFGFQTPEVNSSYPVVANTPYLVVGKVEYTSGVMDRHMWVNPIPEPGALGLLAFAGVLRYIRKQKLIRWAKKKTDRETDQDSL